MRDSKLRFHLSLFVTCSLTAATFKVTSLSSTVSTNPQLDEEKEKERIFPSTFSHIQNRMVITQKKHMPFMIRNSHLLILGLSCDTSCNILSIIISSSLLSVYCFVHDLYWHFPHALPSFFVDNDDHND